MGVVISRNCERDLFVLVMEAHCCDASKHAADIKIDVAACIRWTLIGIASVITSVAALYGTITGGVPTRWFATTLQEPVEYQMKAKLVHDAEIHRAVGAKASEIKVDSSS